MWFLCYLIGFRVLCYFWAAVFVLPSFEILKALFHN